MKKIDVIAISTSYPFIKKGSIPIALNKLNKKDYLVNLIFDCKSKIKYESTSIKDRVKQLNKALLSDSDIIMALSGGYQVNEILDYIDFELIKKNKKNFCGYSDITIFLNAIYKKANIETYLGPNFSTLHQNNYSKFSIEKFELALSGSEFEIKPSKKYKKTNGKKQINSGFWCINEGVGKGKIVGGNLCSFNLLQGTKYIPNLANKILCIEDDNIFLNGKIFYMEFKRNLVSLSQQKNFEKVKGILIGRFESSVSKNFQKKDLKFLLNAIPKLKNIPIIANVDFGHTQPKYTLPIGRYCQIISSSKECKIKILSREKY